MSRRGARAQLASHPRESRIQLAGQILFSVTTTKPANRKPVDFFKSDLP